MSSRNVTFDDALDVGAGCQQCKQNFILINTLVVFLLSRYFRKAAHSYVIPRVQA